MMVIIKLIALLIQSYYVIKQLQKLPKNLTVIKFLGNRDKVIKLLSCSILMRTF